MTLYTPMCTNTYIHAHAHTHTLVLVLVLPLPTLTTWPPIQGVSQQEASGQGTPLAVETHAPTPQPHGPLVQKGYSSVGLQDPQDERGGVQP